MTRVYLKNSRGVKVVGKEPYIKDMTTTAGSSTFTGFFTTTAGGTSIQMANSSATANKIAFFSERLAATITLSNSDGIVLRAAPYVNSGTPNATIRFILSKMVSGGTDVETVIGQGEGTVTLDATANFDNYAITIPTPVTVGVNERLVLRIYAIPAPSQTMGVGELWMGFNGLTGATNDPSLELPNGITFQPNATRLFLRRTNTIGIGTFYDLSTTLGGSTYTSGVVNTQASGTQIQWTRTGGGTLLEWISARFREGWSFESTGEAINALDFQNTAYESNALANAKIRVKLFRWRNGVETECYTAHPASSELSVTAGALVVWNDRTSSGTITQTLTPTEFAEDDRLVMRTYITNQGTMAAGYTATYEYDHNSNTVVRGNSWVQVFATTLFKTESEPSREQTPGGLAMGGVGL